MPEGNSFIIYNGIKSLLQQLLRKLEHTIDRFDGLRGYDGIDLYLRELVSEAVVDLLQGIKAHIVALVAATSGASLSRLGRCGDKLLVGATLLHLVQDARLCNHDELSLIALLRIEPTTSASSRMMSLHSG